MADHLPLIFRAIREGKCLPFLGAGASAGYQHNGTAVPGIPLGGQFTKLFNQRCGLTNGSAINDFRLAAEQLVFQDSGSRDGLEQLIREQVSKVTEPRPIHTALAQLREIRFAITTNYDTLLETAARSQARNLEVHVHDPANLRTGHFLPKQSYKPDDLVLHKMHGNVEQPATMLATRSDYIRYLANLSDPDRGMPESFRKFIIPNHSLLFLGYSLRDWNFLVVWDGVLQKHHDAGTPIKAYAVMHDFVDSDEDFCRDRGIKLLRCDLVEFARRLATESTLAIPQLGIAKAAAAPQPGGAV